MQTDFKTTAGLFAYLFARLMTSGYPSGAKIRKNRPRCSPTGGFLCSFNTITPKSPHSKPFPIPFASVLGVGIVITLSSDQSKVYLGNNNNAIQYELSLWGGGYAIVNSSKSNGISFVVKGGGTIIGIEGDSESYLLCGSDSNGHYIHSDGRITLFPKVRILTEG